MYGADVVPVQQERNYCRDIVAYHVTSCTKQKVSSVSTKCFR